MGRNWRDLRAEFHDVRRAQRIDGTAFRDETFLGAVLGEEAADASKWCVPETAEAREARD